MVKIKVKLLDGPPGAAGFIGWSRLQQHLKKSGEIKKGETVVSFEADEVGVHYYVRRDSKS